LQEGQRFLRVGDAEKHFTRSTLPTDDDAPTADDDDDDDDHGEW